MALSTIACLVMACGGDAGHDEIIDIGKPCTAASDCDDVCTVARGASEGQCSIECAENSDCPSFMDCIESSSTGERRCFKPTGLVVTSLARLCDKQCHDVHYFCSSSVITELEHDECGQWCSGASDADMEAFIDCVSAQPRYESACPAAECVLDRI